MIKIINIIFMLLFNFIISCSPKPEKVLIIKQWHLAPKINSSDIEKSKSLEQYAHQKDLYLLLKQKIKEGYTTIIAEGCEGEVDADFKSTFNGWDFKKLSEQKDKPEYDDIVTMAPLKMKVFDPKTKVICGDNYRLIEHNQLAMSDLRGFLGFYINVKTLKDPTYLPKVKTALKELGHKEVDDVAEFLKNKLIQSWDTSFLLIHKRNDFFIEKIIHQEIPPIVVIGGIHIEDLTKKLKDKGIAFEIATPKDYPIKDERMILSIANLVAKLRSK